MLLTNSSCWSLERALEDHEVVKNVMSLWPKKKELQPTLSLKIFPTKNQLWNKTSPVSHSSVEVAIPLYKG